MDGINLSTFFTGFSAAFFTIFACLQLSAPRRTRFQTVLGYTLVVWALFSWKDIILSFPQFYNEQTLNIIMLVDGWSAITYAVFIFEITQPGWTTWRRIAWHVLPFAAFTIVYALKPDITIIYAYAVFLWCYAWTVVIIAFVRCRRYIHYIHQNYSNIDEIDISWLRPIFGFCILSQLTWFATSLLQNVYIDTLYYITTLLMWVMVLRYTRNFSPVIIKQSESTESGIKDYAFKDRVETILKDEELYLNKQLTLEELAGAVGTNRTYLSSYFNNVVGKPFYDYVNQLRITQKAIPLMRAHPEYTLEYIAEQSGFNSISTFRRAFIKFNGKNPSQWRQDT